MNDDTVKSNHSEQALSRLRIALAPLLCPDASPALFAGMVGETVRTTGASPTLEDFRTQFVPGLNALGISAELIPMPATPHHLRRLLAERLRYAVPVPLLRFDDTVQAVRLDPETSSEGAVDVSETPAERLSHYVDTGVRRLARAAIVRGLSGNDVIREGLSPRRRQTLDAPVTALRPRFSHVIRLRATEARGHRLANILSALLRGEAFADAFPQRALTEKRRDAERRVLAAEFLAEIAGTKRDPASVRLRRASAAFESASVPSHLAEARSHVREAIFLAMRLPSNIQRALLLPPDLSLSGVERRELIYLARAGTLFLKILATRRLSFLPASPDICRTLEQLAFDRHSWVRASTGIEAPR